MNAREQLNGFYLAGIVLAGLAIGGILGSGMVFWIIVAIGLWWAFNSGGIR